MAFALGACGGLARILTPAAVNTCTAPKLVAGFLTWYFMVSGQAAW
jgi:hypothetical protein